MERWLQPACGVMLQRTPRSLRIGKASLLKDPFGIPKPMERVLQRNAIQFEP